MTNNLLAGHLPTASAGNPAVPNGRYWAKAVIAGIVDDNCVIGFDHAMQTIFFQSGDDEEDTSPFVWLGTQFGEISTMT